MTKQEFRQKIFTCAKVAHDLGTAEFEPISEKTFLQIDTVDLSSFFYFLKVEFKGDSVNANIFQASCLTCKIRYADLYIALTEVCEPISDGLNWAFD